MFRALCIALAVLLTCVAAQAFDNAIITSAETQEASMRSNLERVQTAISLSDVTDVQLAEQRGIVEKLQLDALAQADALNAPVKDLTQQLNQLGPAPAKGASESASIAAQRQSLTDSVNRVSAAQKQFSLLSLEAEQTTSKISSLQRTQFSQRVFRPDISILNPQLWKDTATGITLLYTRLYNIISVWWQVQSPSAQWSALGVMPGLYLGIILIYRAGRRIFSNWMGYAPADKSTLSPLRRLWRVAKGALICAIMLLLFGVMTTVTLDLTKLSTPRFDQLAMALLSFISPAIFQTTLAYLICSPNQPEARLIAIDRSAARTIPV
ncbi:MAG: DUF3772 domain-containing protein, partial [Alphaproteobacteria bacterium]|nr:DUF3772 domain-containing protein [Alphaproteobacteria bacterium]